MPNVPVPIADEQTIKTLGDMAADAGLRRIVMLAWRDLDDVEAGGSEIHAHNVAALWARAGLEVTMRSSYAQGHPPRTVRAGYRVIRKAGRYMVFPRSVLADLAGRHGPHDGLVEIWNGMPFFSPVWYRGPKMIWLHHVHGPMWEMTLPPNLAKVGMTIEERIAPLFYRRSPIVTLSESSKRELVGDLGFSERRVSVVEPGIDARFCPGSRGSAADRSPTPLAVAVGRLVPVKDFSRLIRIFHRVHEHSPDAQLVIVGDGYERELLESLITDLEAGSYIRLAGRTSDQELIDLYRAAWFVTSASVREGWGMTLTEAAACGTPAVASRIAGHADAVIDGQSGLLGDDDAELAGHMIRLIDDRRLRERLQAGALDRASELTWGNTAIGTLAALAADASRRNRPIASSPPPTPRR